MIRPATAHDIPALIELGRQVCADTYAGLTPPGYIAHLLANYWTPEAFTQAMTSAHCQLLVAVETETVIGLVETQVLAEDSASMWKLYVRKAGHGQGWGRKLLEAAATRLPTTIKTLQTEYLTTNLKAGQFYAAQGFAFDREEAETFDGVTLTYTYLARPQPRGPAQN